MVDKFLLLVAASALIGACQQSDNLPKPPITVGEEEKPQPHQIVAKGETFTCTPTAVYDGDGPVWCSEGPKLRLAGIAAREMNGTCRSNQPCPDASAESARDVLVMIFGGSKGERSTGHIIVRGQPMTCESLGQAVGSRTGAWCKLADGEDLSCRMLASGTVLKWDRYWRGHRC